MAVQLITMVPSAEDAMARLSKIPKDLQETLKTRTQSFADQVRLAAEQMNPNEAETVPLHVVPREDRWAVVAQGSKEAERVSGTKEEAVERARRIAKSRETHLVIHRKDGTIQEVHNYR